ncbi:MAG: ABC transporter ATP-binding protein/permease [Omnitrophica bacterium]|nr:ABC transporter ATP-binding protein/permease [Candidatus Omnitrophota bacterium]
MKLLPLAVKYLKKYPGFTSVILCLIIIASVFEGATFGMMIPLIQSMTNKSAPFLKNVFFTDYMNFSHSSVNQAGIISFIFVFMFLLIIFKNVSSYVANISIGKLRFFMIRDLRTNLMNNLLDYDIKFFDHAKIGHIISSINAETQRMGDFIYACLNLTVFFVKICAYLAVLFLISWKASIVVFALILTVLLPIELIMRQLGKIGKRLSGALADYNYKLTEMLNGIRLIKASGTEIPEKANFKNVTNNIYRFRAKSVMYRHLVLPVSEISVFGLIVLCFIVIINTREVDVAKAFPFIATYLVTLTKALTQLGGFNNSRSQAVGQVAAFKSYENMLNPKGRKTIKSGNIKIEELKCAIELDSVNFSYREGKQILKNVSIKIPKGKVTAFVGPSGAGKSTIVNLIARFYDINSGRILVDGIEFEKLSLKDWRNKIGFVSQDIFLFNDSVKNNISYGHGRVSEEEAVLAAKAAGVHDFITGLPEGYDTMLGERGVKLSGGQKQRISIARAILRNPEILILDEATSSLDTETEKLITEAINNLTRGRTVIAIAHRLSTILHADNIVLIDKGEVVETGTHMELFGKNGLYRKLYDSQFYVERQTQEA